MLLDANNLKQFQKLLENELRPVLLKHHASSIEQYDQMRLRNGPSCPFCIALLKQIFASEYKRLGTDFITRFRQNNWDGYE